MVVHDVPIMMSDGVVLMADVGYPTDQATGERAAGTFPVLLTQNPYTPFVQPTDYFVKRGYIHVIEDVRNTTSRSPAPVVADAQFFGPRNAQDGVGNTMNAGRVVIHGDAGDVLGYGMRGGRVVLVGATDEIATNAFNPKGRPVADIVDEAEQKIFNIGEEGSRMKQGFQSMDTLVVDLLDRVQEMADNPNDITGVPTGFYDLDRMTSGFQAGDMIVLAARPSMGKTALAINIAEHVALNEGLPVAVFSMEMGAAQLAVRVVGSIGRINQTALRTGKLSDEEWPRLTEAIEKLRTVSLHIDESAGLNSSELRANARTLGNTGVILLIADLVLKAQALGMAFERIEKPRSEAGACGL